jgi:hypothetical protein
MLLVERKDVNLTELLYVIQFVLSMFIFFARLNK